MGKNLNYLYAQLIVLLNKYATETQGLSVKEQQRVLKKLRRQLAPGIFVFNKAWREISRGGQIYLQKMQE
ncbi:hypothetical protein [Vagococcus sp. WN89Y]|uniref:hypothetical protein n=1 Tax=Vagococcus sp. WN89Y TaxID=3457258 RepID=UPI003FCD0108